MAYPVFVSRLANYTQANSAGLAFSYANLDSEWNNMVADVNSINSWVRNITDSTGKLVNLASATAQALAGSQRFVATASQTVFTTTITYDSAMTNLNTEVFAQGVKIDPNTVTVSNSGGFLAVTLGTGRTAGDVVVVNAFTSGSGVLARLALTTAGNGASLIGIQDAGGIYAAANVETALAEVMTSLNTLTTTLGTIGNYLKKDGSVTMTGALAMGSQKITGLADGTAGTDGVTVNQLSAATSSLSELYTQFVRADGSTPMTGALDMGSHKITNLSTPTASTDAATKGYVDGANLLPAGCIMPYGGGAAPSGWVACDGTTYDGTIGTYTNLWTALGTRFGGTGQSAFKVPDLRGMTVVGAGSAQTYTDPVLGSKTTSTRSIGDKFGEEKHAQTTAELPAHSHDFDIYPNGMSTGPVGLTIVGSYGGANVQATRGTGTNTAFNICQPSTAILYIIKL